MSVAKSTAGTRRVHCGSARVLRLSYGDATDLYRVNLGWLNQGGSQPRGFNLDLERGYWSRNQADADDRDDAANDGRIARVVPFVRDTRNAVVMRFDPACSGPELMSLQAAFKEAIQRHFQLEPRELAAEAMPSRDDQREILFYEASEGGAGVLRQLAEDPAVVPALARQALEICHYAPDTLDDLAVDRCGRACYECLLDYGNQPDHRHLDRALIRDLLAELSHADCRPAGGAGTRASVWTRFAIAATVASNAGGSTWWIPWRFDCRATPSTAFRSTARAPTSSIGRRTPRFTSTARRTMPLTRSARMRRRRES